MRTAAKEEIVAPLAALPLGRNPHQGHQLPTALLYPVRGFVCHSSQPAYLDPYTILASDLVAPPNTGADWRSRANCAADFGNKYSIASGISALTGISKYNPFLSTAFGNDAASISDIATGRNRMGAAISEFFSNPGSKNVLSFAVRGVGAIPTGGVATADLGVTGAGSYFVKAWNTPTIAGTVVGKTAGAALSTFTKYKAIYDFSIYGLGLASCW